MVDGDSIAFQTYRMLYLGYVAVPLEQRDEMMNLIRSDPKKRNDRAQRFAVKLEKLIREFQDVAGVDA